MTSAPPVSPHRQPRLTVPTWMHLLSGWVHKRPATWIRLGNLETRLVADALADVRIDRPVYIAGLARAGTTVLLEQLARHPAVATHRYIDYPPVLTPYWWNRWLALLPRVAEEARERAHRDGIRITALSPEAFEEMVWMAFFPQLHNPAHSAVFDHTASHSAFEQFYRDHIRKLLAVHGRSRYVAKGNYNLTRLGYLQRLHPDARFIIAVRDPVWHIASLMKQHALFCAGEAEEPRALEHMRRVGHYEFGLDRRPLNVGDDAMVERIAACWHAGRDIDGWALQWAALYGHLHELLERDERLRNACLIVRYEDLCGEPATVLARVMGHAGLEFDQSAIVADATGIRAPSYYRPAFSASDTARIQALTGPVAAHFGY